MKTVLACVGSAACLGLALVSVKTAGAQEKPAVQTTEPGFHRMEIYNGPFRTVHFFSVGASAGEQASLRDLERSENEAALADQLSALRRQYVADESVLENRRRQVQQLLYGYASEVSAALPTGPVPAAYPFGYGYYTPYAYGSSAYGYPYLPSVAAITSVNRLAGVGDEGPIKAELARTLATQATPEYAAQAYRLYNNALARAGEPNSRIASVAGVPPAKGGIRPLEYQAPPGEFRLARPGAHVVVSRRVGDSIDKVEGTVVSETGDWVVVDTKAGRRTIAKGNIVDILEPK